MPASLSPQPSLPRVDGAPRSARVRVVVADDHPLFRDGIERAIRERPDLHLVGVAADGREALAMICGLAPRVAVLDLRLPGLSGLRVLNALTRDAVPTRVVFLSAIGDAEVVYRAVQAGAAGYFRKEASRDAILDGIASVARGRSAIEPVLQNRLIDQIRARGVTRERPVLTARERQVLALMAEGLSGPQIAERLIVALPTVKSYQARLYEKLGVSDRAAAVAQGMRRRYLE
jgi:two-component system, NarL family, nitrate/nitrite response regulator NarL